MPGTEPATGERAAPYSPSDLGFGSPEGRHAAQSQSWAPSGSDALDSAHDEAEAIVNDALEQAALVNANAERSAEQLLALYQEDPAAFRPLMDSALEELRGVTAAQA